MSQLPYPSDDGAMTEQVNLSSERDQAASETEAIRESIDGQFYYPPVPLLFTFCCINCRLLSALLLLLLIQH